jgi:hypothetical protein
MNDNNTRAVFDWRVYADATCAGLTALIPLPVVDLVFEAYFRRRMPEAIARTRGRELGRLTVLRLGRRRGGSLSVRGCLAIPITVVRYILKKLWRKIVYVFAMADAAAQLSEYWHRAYLIEHMILAGHLDDGVDVERAVTVFGRVMDQADTSPLRGLARQVASGTPRIVRTLVRARRRGSVEEAESLGKILRSHWGVAEQSLQAVAISYNRLYRSWPNPPTEPSQHDGSGSSRSQVIEII